jgi:uncharacterized membrane protein YdcZ (DUF606 family)
MNYLPHLFAVLIGASLTVQVGMNATVSGALSSALIATIINFFIGLVAPGGLALATGARIPRPSGGWSGSRCSLWASC